MALNPDQYRLTEAEHQATFDNDIEPDLFAGAKPSGQPVAVIFGGQPGAGKSAAVDAVMRDLEQRGGAVQIIGDDLRGYHPQYARLMERDDRTAAFYTDRDTGQWVEKAIAQAKDQRVNIVIEGTMRDGNKVAETMQSLRAAGYEIDARALAVNERLSQQGIIQRYENQKADRGAGRMTTPQAHQAAYDGMPATLERIERDKMADRITIYRRGGDAIYSNELRAGEWVREPKACATVKAERARSMTLQEHRAFVGSYDRLVKLIESPERHADAKEISTISDLRQEARLRLAAEVFRKAPPGRAIKEFPDLARAYAAMSSFKKSLDRKTLQPVARARAVAAGRERVATLIERGEIPVAKVAEKVVIKADIDRDI